MPLTILHRRIKDPHQEVNQVLLPGTPVSATNPTLIPCHQDENYSRKGSLAIFSLNHVLAFKLFVRILLPSIFPTTPHQFLRCGDPTEHSIQSDCDNHQYTYESADSDSGHLSTWVIELNPPSDDIHNHHTCQCKERLVTLHSHPVVVADPIAAMPVLDRLFDVLD